MGVLRIAMASSHAIKLLALSLVLVSTSACVCSDAGSAPAQSQLMLRGGGRWTNAPSVVVVQRGCEEGCPRRRLFSESEAGKRGETGAQPGAAHLAASQHCIEDAFEPSAQKVRINLMFGAIQKN